MESIHEISDMIIMKSNIHSKFLNSCLSFLVQSIRTSNQSFYVSNPIMMEKAERSVAFTLVNLNNFHAVYRTSKVLYENFIIHINSISYTNSQLMNELRYLIKDLYKNESWKKVALEALDSFEPGLTKIYFDLSPVQKSTPWLSNEIQIRGRIIKNEQVD